MLKADKVVSKRALPALAGLALPGQLTRTSWLLPKELPFDQWELCGGALSRIEGSVQWWLGDWWAHGEHKYGERLKAIEDEASPLRDLDFATMRTYGWVARAVTMSIRIDTLSFAHHRYVAALPPSKQRKSLARAEREGWSANQLKAAIARQAAIDRTTKADFDAKALGKFVVLYADPPWQYENPAMGGSNRSIENHYPTMTIEELCMLPIGSIAHEDSVLLMWATSPKLKERLEVIEAWGFEYRTAMAWVKDKIGMGYYFRERFKTALS
jgi:MT-A70